MKWFMILNEFNEISILARILLAMVLGGLIGLEREKNKRPAGFRTHILVCVGACMTALIPSALAIAPNLSFKSEKLMGWKISQLPV